MGVLDFDFNKLIKTNLQPLNKMPPPTRRTWVDGG
jgi:hypothetical protein